MYTSRWGARFAVALAPFVATAWIGACAADPGDASKIDGLGVPSPDVSTTPQVDAATSGQDQSSSFPQVDAPSGFVDAMSLPDTITTFADSPSLPDSSTQIDTGTQVDAPATSPDAEPADSAPVDTGPPPPPPTGCATGATVIAMKAKGASGNFNVLGAVCVTFTSSVSGWNASNVQGRSVTAVGSTTQMPVISGDSLGNQPGLSPGTDGYIYWNYTAGSVDFTSMSIF